MLYLPLSISLDEYGNTSPLFLSAKQHPKSETTNKGDASEQFSIRMLSDFKSLQNNSFVRSCIC